MRRLVQLRTYACASHLTQLCCQLRRLLSMPLSVCVLLPPIRTTPGPPPPPAAPNTAPATTSTAATTAGISSEASTGTGMRSNGALRVPAGTSGPLGGGCSDEPAALRPAGAELLGSVLTQQGLAPQAPAQQVMDGPSGGVAHGKSASVWTAGQQRRIRSSCQLANCAVERQDWRGPKHWCACPTLRSMRTAP